MSKLIDERDYSDSERFGHYFLTFARDQAVWSQETFGTDKQRGPIGPLKHLIKEANECIKTPNDPLEYADLLILIMDASRRAGISPLSLLYVARRKMIENKEREWPPPSPDNNEDAVEHVRDAAPAVPEALKPEQVWEVPADQPTATPIQINEYREKAIQYIESAMSMGLINGHTAAARMKAVKGWSDQEVTECIQKRNHSRDTWAAVLRLPDLAVTQEVAEAIEDMKGPNPARPTSMAKLVNDLQDWLDNKYANFGSVPTVSWCTTVTTDTIVMGPFMIWNSEEGYEFIQDPENENKDRLSLQGCIYAYQASILELQRPFLD